MKHYESQRWSTVSDESGTVVLSSSGPGLHAYPAGFSGRIRLLTSWESAGSYRAGTGILNAGFSLTSHEGASDPVAATRAGYSFSVPLEVRIVPRDQSGLLTSAAYSFIDVQGGTLQLSTLKRWQHGDGLIGRFFNPSPEPVEVDFVFSGLEPYVYEANLLEGIIVLVKRDRRVGVQFGPYEVKTLLLGVYIPGAADADQPEDLFPVLERPYPNPFSDTVNLTYRIGSPSRVRLTVHDVLGRTVATVVDDRINAGRYEATWHGRDVNNAEVAAGVYIVTLETSALNGERSRAARTVVRVR
jgi:hypothetical protein